MPSLLKMVAEMGLNIAPFQKGLDKAKQAAGTGAASIGREFQSIIARYFGVAALVGFGASIVRRVGEIKDLAEQFNLTTDEVQKFGHAFEEIGLRAQDAGAAIDRLNRSRREAVESSQDLRNAFASFGISVEQLNDAGTTTADIFKRIGQALKDGVVTDRERAALMELMGKSGARFAEAMKNLDKPHPALIPQEEIERLEKAENHLRNIRREIEAFTVVGASNVLKAWAEGLDELLEAQNKWLKPMRRDLRPQNARQQEQIGKAAADEAAAGVGGILGRIFGPGKDAKPEKKELFVDKIALQKRLDSLNAQRELEEKLSSIAFGRLTGDEQTKQLREDQAAIEAEIAHQKQLQLHGLYTEERFAQIIAELKLKQLDAEEKILAIRKQGARGTDLIALSRSVGSANPAQFATPERRAGAGGAVNLGPAVEVLHEINKKLGGHSVILGR